ncbi:hypothetical protein SAMN04244547_04685 [Azotobacter vinelandii]|nr:hypothetical protein SAMN04244547_04685 [Azotobacter vinelandii]
MIFPVFPTPAFVVRARASAPQPSLRGTAGARYRPHADTFRRSFGASHPEAFAHPP